MVLERLSDAASAPSAQQVQVSPKAGKCNAFPGFFWENAPLILEKIGGLGTGVAFGL
jgi:hypothetical protein